MVRYRVCGRRGNHYATKNERMESVKEKIKYIMTGIACATAIAAVIVAATLGTNSGVAVNHKIALSTSAFSVGMCACNLIYLIALQLDEKRENERQHSNQKGKR